MAPMDWGSAMSFGQGAATGVKDGAVSLAEGLWSLGTGAFNAGVRAATDRAYRQAVMSEAKSLADRSVDYGGRLIDDPAARRQAYEQMQELAGSLKQQFVDARDLAEREGRLGEFYGKVVGRGGFEVATFIVPVAMLAALGKAGTVAKGAEAADLAKAVEGAKSLAAAKAGQAVQVCDEVVKGFESINFSRPQLQHAFKHASDFGVAGNASTKTLDEFSATLQRHVESMSTKAIVGTYRGKPVTHFIDLETGLNVIRDKTGNFLSGWRLSQPQLEHVLKNGKLGGG